MLFTEYNIENIMETATMEIKDYNYFPGYAGSYYEPPEPEELEITIMLTREIQLTKEQIAGLQELKKDPYFKQYCESYLQDVLKKKLYDDELDYWETIVSEEDIEIKLIGNTLSIEVYYAG